MPLVIHQTRTARQLIATNHCLKISFYQTQFIFEVDQLIVYYNLHLIIISHKKQQFLSIFVTNFLPKLQITLCSYHII